MDIPQGLVPELPDEHWHVERYLHGEFVRRECHLTSLYAMGHIVDYCAFKAGYTFRVEVVKDDACANDMLNERKQLRQEADIERQSLVVDPFAQQESLVRRGISTVRSRQRARAISNYRTGSMCHEYANGLLALSFGE